jgi:hypothetical protein
MISDSRKCFNSAEETGDLVSISHAAVTKQSVLADVQAGCRDLRPSSKALCDRACVKVSAKRVGFIFSDSRKCINSAEETGDLVSISHAAVITERVGRGESRMSRYAVQLQSSVR